MNLVQAELTKFSYRLLRYGLESLGIALLISFLFITITKTSEQWSWLAVTNATKDAVLNVWDKLIDPDKALVAVAALALYVLHMAIISYLLKQVIAESFKENARIDYDDLGPLGDVIEGAKRFHWKMLYRMPRLLFRGLYGWLWYVLFQVFAPGHDLTWGEFVDYVLIPVRLATTVDQAIGAISTLVVVTILVTVGTIVFGGLHQSSGRRGGVLEVQK